MNELENIININKR